jgi:hypothetical protein
VGSSAGERNLDVEAHSGPKDRALALFTLAALVVLVTIFLGTLIAITPVTRSLDAETYIRVQQPMTRHVTPIASISGVVAGLAAVTLTVRRRRRNLPCGGLVVAVVCLVTLGVSSLVVNVPINSDVQGWVAAHPPADWASVRDRWDIFHVIRSLLSLVAFYAVFRDYLPRASGAFSTPATSR